MHTHDTCAPMHTHTHIDINTTNIHIPAHMHTHTHTHVYTLTIHDHIHTHAQPTPTHANTHLHELYSDPHHMTSSLPVLLLIPMNTIMYRAGRLVSLKMLLNTLFTASD